jgi:hypothetical protein
VKPWRPADMTADAWFSDSKASEETRRAKLVCRHCPVQVQCLEEGKPERWGIWGGVYRSESKGKSGGGETDLPVSAIGAQRRLRALATLGWGGKDVAGDIRRYIGLSLSPRRLEAVRSGDETEIPPYVHEGIVRAYKHLHGSLNSGAAANTTMHHAREMGWATPREWKGLDLDA